jgi:murein L,D-transpeptidase YafK
MKWPLLLSLLIGPPVMARTIDDVMKIFGPPAEKQLKARFEKAKAAHPPKKIALLAFKQERKVELWAEEGGKWKRVHSYPILGASGMAGPKLREGDLQVPEGVYRLTVLNPNSSYHLSMRVDYPNEFDRGKAASEKRSRLGGDIYIHGKDVSIGCIALGDDAIEELFTLVARIGRENVKVIIAPVDFRVEKRLPALRYQPPWIEELYGNIRKELGPFQG